MTIRNVLSIAGSDPSGGAGIQADLKAFSARGTYGMAALTALTAQNTRGVIAIQALPPDFVRAEIEAVFADIRVDAVKIGMIANAEIAEAVADVLGPYAETIPIVLDPVMVAKGGSPLLAPDAKQAVIERLLPLASLVTPNLPETAALLGEAEAVTREEMADQARRLLERGPKAVLVKGGHLETADSPDVLAEVRGLTWLEGKRIATSNTHGTGCTLSSAIAAELAKGASMVSAVTTAKAYLAEAIAAADKLDVGSGHGPVHHFVQLWESEGITRR
ncbi:bifunctional hydroxymethylpyrimidine kinase/phosphomethylpyrimidine kinase [Aliirhizobium terrae]|uniref:bifunctional hydroxymethylpyrimidine kinase/phosphomethylpyrimidine kinase n=1 Tax=Terrirhizobium terrae TaxID=2926709 RepID=UPI002575E41C|nr:bifunctional hydroxymethylpyrimidine kinase/phosphomethylpyrimidine kinase [Rhizobium sp. CC-CFT758]WJH40155.1 bifunctional hydroxymethylpyrimidine kinase/phosphomethylpyrimidine kinase [Rhizobium sp. CC-CFT758]